jgi:hypothetical protein
MIKQDTVVWIEVGATKISFRLFAHVHFVYGRIGKMFQKRAEMAILPEEISQVPYILFMEGMERIQLVADQLHYKQLYVYRLTPTKKGSRKPASCLTTAYPNQALQFFVLHIFLAPFRYRQLSELFPKLHLRLPGSPCGV